MTCPAICAQRKLFFPVSSGPWFRAGLLICVSYGKSQTLRFLPFTFFIDSFGKYCTFDLTLIIKKENEKEAPPEIIQYKIWKSPAHLELAKYILWSVNSHLKVRGWLLWSVNPKLKLIREKKNQHLWSKVRINKNSWLGWERSSL